MRQIHRVAGAILEIRRIVRREGIALIHSNGFRAHVYGGIAAKLAGISEVWTTHTVEIPSWSTWAISRIPTRQVISNCPRTDQAFRRLGFPTTMIWPGVNAPHLEALASRVSRVDLERRYGIPANRRWLTVAARLQRYKGHAEFLQALSQLPEALGVHGIILGGTLFQQEAGLRKELETLAEQLGLLNRVTFTGYVPDDEFAAFLARSALVGHPAHDEDFGLSVAEAQALGVPVVAFASVGPSAIIDPGRTGWLVPIGDVETLSATLNSALLGNDSLATVGIAARERARSLFGSRTHAAATAQVYGQVLDGTRE
jgi:glycosyltransferase involved in cell wall biosynthesis